MLLEEPEREALLTSRAPTPLRRALLICVLSLLGSILLVGLNAYLPDVGLFTLIQLLFGIFLASCAFSTILGVRRHWLAHPDLRTAIIFLAVITLAVFLLHTYVINAPPTAECYSSEKKAYGCIMDEVYYVPSAQSLLSGTRCQPYADSCNLEHPFLAKALIAAGIELFQVTDLGWRIVPTVLGTLSIPLLFVITFLISKNKRMAAYASLLLAFDTLFFVHSGAALIDVPTTFFALCSFLFYFYRRGFWRFDSMVLSGVAMGLAGLSKETAIFLFGALLTYHTAFYPGHLKAWATTTAKIVLPAAIVFAGGIQVYDSLYTSASLPTFVQQVEFMLRYGSQLIGPGWTDVVTNAPITPLNWILFYSPISYLVTHVTVSSSQSSVVYVGVGYYGITNMTLVWMAFFWVPLVIYLRSRKLKEGLAHVEPTSDLRASEFALIWFLWGYVPYIILWLYGRVTYPFYILPAVPALAIGAAFLVSREWFPSRLAVVYLLANAGWFFWYFPEKSFLPVWLRALIGK